MYDILTISVSYRIMFKIIKKSKSYYSTGGCPEDCGRASEDSHLQE